MPTKEKHTKINFHYAELTASSLGYADILILQARDSLWWVTILAFISQGRAPRHNDILAYIDITLMGYQARRHFARRHIYSRGPEYHEATPSIRARQLSHVTVITYNEAPLFSRRTARLHLHLTTPTSCRVINIISLRLLHFSIISFPPSLPPFEFPRQIPPSSKK